MSSKGVGTYAINSSFASGNQVWYEKAVGNTATGDVFTIGTSSVKVGNTSNDIDFGWYGTGSKSFVIDLGAATATSAGLNWSIDVGYFLTGAPVKQTLTAKTGGQTLTVAEAGVITVSTDDVYIYLPTYIGNTGLTYTIKPLASHSAGVHVRAYGTEKIDANIIKTSGAQYDTLTIAAGSQGWNVVSKYGTWTGTL